MSLSPLLNTKEVAAILGFSTAKIRRMVRNKQIPHIRLGGARGDLRFRQQDIEGFIDQRVVRVYELAPARKAHVASRR